MKLNSVNYKSHYMQRQNGPAFGKKSESILMPIVALIAFGIAVKGCQKVAEVFKEAADDMDSFSMRSNSTEPPQTPRKVDSYVSTCVQKPDYVAVESRSLKPNQTVFNCIKSDLFSTAKENFPVLTVERAAECLQSAGNIILYKGEKSNPTCASWFKAIEEQAKKIRIPEFIL